MVFRIHLILSGIVLVMAMWLSSGSMSPYSAYSANSELKNQFPYIVSVDQREWRKLFLMFDGKPRREWRNCAFNRRILHAVLSYPFWKALGFSKGGIIANMLIQIFAFYVFVAFWRSRLGDTAGIVGMWLLATYPGITYWVGVPFGNAIIVPVCMVSSILLWELTEATSTGKIVLLSLGLGVLSLGYDILPFYGPAFVLVLMSRALWRKVPVVTLCCCAPTALWLLTVKFVLNLKLINANSGVYLGVVKSFVVNDGWGTWLSYAAEYPSVLAHNYVFSGFVALPVAFAVAVALSLRKMFPKLGLYEVALLFPVFMIFTVINLAPEHHPWPMRGYGMARLYQATFTVYIIYLMRVVQSSCGELDLGKNMTMIGLSKHASRLQVLTLSFCFLVVLHNALVAFGSLTLNSYSEAVYWQFYGANENTSNYSLMIENIRNVGRLPLGF